MKNSFANFNENIAIMNQWRKVVLLHDNSRDVTDRNTHIFIPRHRVVKVKICNVKGGKTGAGGRDDTVAEDLSSGQIGSGSADFSGVVNLVAACSVPNTFGFHFVGLEFSYDA